MWDDTKRSGFPLPDGITLMQSGRRSRYVLSERVTTILDAVSRWGPDPRAYKALGNIAVAVEPEAESLVFNVSSILLAN